MQADNNDHSTLVAQTAFMLPGALTIDSVTNLSEAAEEFLSKQEGKSNLAVDASQVESITTPGAQMIVALSKLVERNGGQLAVVNPSQNFTKIFEVLGLQSLTAKWGGNG